MTIIGIVCIRYFRIFINTVNKKVWKILFSRGEKPLNPAQFATCPPGVFRHSRQANSALSGPKFRAGGPKFCTGPIICTSSKFCLVLDLVLWASLKLGTGAISGNISLWRIAVSHQMYTNYWILCNAFEASILYRRDIASSVNAPCMHESICQFVICQSGCQRANELLTYLDQTKGKCPPALQNENLKLQTYFHTLYRYQLQHRCKHDLK